MITLSDGANAPLAGHRVLARVTGPVDLTALVVGADGKVAGDADMVFFNQPTAPGVRLEGTTAHLDLSALRPGAVRVVLAVSPQEPGATFAGTTVTLTVEHDGGEARFAPAGLSTQTVAVLAELYQRGGGWKVRAVGQGYDDGLAGLATDFGVDVEDEPAPAPALNLGKEPLGAVELTKRGSAVIPLDLSKREQAGGTVFRVDLKWDGGSAARRQRGADLDLYALWADREGRTGAVYYRDLGSLDGPPFVRLRGDSTTPGRETVEITRADRLAHVLICAYSAVENGTGSFKSYGARAVVDDGSGSRVTVPLFDDSEKYWVAIALLSFGDDGVRVQQVEDYGHQTTEARPLLHADGRIEMGAGPVEFKSQDD
ncbi:TerD family protein [Kineococcus sp. SYSU DK003]|uniref:TerD family protein n=1 Tax=Kineococcus sp. SYSU DK003 TaxID=3383124 RepID=UPI003D7D02E5